MFQPILNLFRLFWIFKERGNWPLIRRSRKQLREFILCRNRLNPKSIFSVPLYWHRMFKGLDMLVWRLETFGFLFLPETSEDDKKQINRCLPDPLSRGSTP